MEPMEKWEFPDGHVLEIHPDDCPDDPRSWDNVGVMACFHNRYALGDKLDYRSGDYSGWEGFRKQLEKDHNIYMILPLYMYDHSGIAISVSRSEYPFNCPWDAGQVGFIFATREVVEKEWDDEETREDWVRERLLAEVALYNQYLSGDVYYYVLKDKEGEVVESCGGFFGLDHEKSGLAENIPPVYRESMEGFKFVSPP